MSSNKLAPEWERQDAVVIVWPHAYSDWARDLEEIENSYTELCKHICRHQRLIIITYNQTHQKHIKLKLNNSYIDCENILFANIPTNDTWVRDYGPICINDHTDKLILNFKFDAWGEKYSYALDDEFTNKFSEHYKLSTYKKDIDIVLEGGNLEINSHGELLCSSTRFNREVTGPNKELTTIEKQFTKWFGSNNTYWIDDVQLVGDDTDGHIDTLARFCLDDVIVFSAVNNTSDANSEALEQLELQLKSIQEQSHNRIELIPLPLPKPIFSSNRQLPACYTNFLILNESVLVPTFKDKQDDLTLRLFEELFLSREIIGIDSNTLIRQFGGIHCATMQIPEGILQ